jgi:hypothetical protein
LLIVSHNKLKPKDRTMTKQEIQAAQAALASYYAGSVGASIAKSIADGNAVVLDANTGKKSKPSAEERANARRSYESYCRGDV